jgi:hypothetical protein
MVSALMGIMIFKIVILRIPLGNSMTCTRPNHLHQNKKKQPTIVDHTRLVAKALSTHVSTILMQVSVPAEGGSNMPLVDYHFRAHSSP